jgi:hypothetical protein
MNVIPGVESVGEVRHLQLGPDFVKCTAHKNCDVFNDHNFGDVIYDEDLYQHVADACETNTLIISDKRTKHYERFIAHHDFDAIVLFKSIYAFAASDKRHHPRHKDRRGNPIFPPVSIAKSMKMFCDGYDPVLNWSLPKRKVYVSLEHLCVDPRGQLKRICELLGLQDPPTLIPELKSIDCHNVLGNYEGARSPKLFVDNRWKKELSYKQKRRIESNLKAKNLYKTLLEKAK